MGTSTIGTCRRAGFAVAAAIVAAALVGCDPTTETDTTPLPTTSPASSAAIAEECARIYADGFAYDSGRDLDDIAEREKPARAETFRDDAYGTCVTRVTDASIDFADSPEPVPTFARNDYSRRQAFNADGSMYLIYDSGGFWHVYDAETTGYLKRLDGPAGDAEPQWHPTDPDRLYYLPPSGGDALVYELTVSTNTSVVVGDLAERLDEIWPGADQAFTGAEGSPSADGRYWCFMVRAGYDDGGGEFESVGLVTWDLVEDRILGSHDLNGEAPNALSMSPSGKYCVIQTAPDDQQEARTVAFTRDFSEERLIHRAVEHADIAIGADGADTLISIDYDSDDGTIFMVNLDTGERTDLMPTYLGDTATAVHFSGKAYDTPGWVLVSTYDDYGGDREWLHRKVFAMSLEAEPQVRNLAFHHSDGSTYWMEPHASVNRDFTRVLFNSNWGSGEEDIDAYMITLPPGVALD